jgi:Signal transduction histidine kinase
MTGKPVETLIGQDEFAFMDDTAAAKINAMKDRVIETEESVSYQISPTFPDGSERIYSTTRYPYYDDQGDLDGTITICRDVTDLEEHKRQLEVLDRVLRHNLNQNMTVVQGYASIVERESEGKISHQAEKITENATEILELSQKQRKITEFLSESHTTDQIKIGPIVERLAKRVENEYPDSNISIGTVSEVQVSAINAIEEAIEELLVNSIVHSGQSKPDATVHVEATEERCSIQISDENPQMAEMDQEILRDEPELGDLQHGSGLGLWLAKLIVDHSRGSIRYEANEPRGNIITIELPRQ